jgi:hypothetical protein
MCQYKKNSTTKKRKNNFAQKEKFAIFLSEGQTTTTKQTEIAMKHTQAATVLELQTILDLAALRTKTEKVNLLRERKVSVKERSILIEKAEAVQAKRAQRSDQKPRFYKKTIAQRWRFVEEKEEIKLFAHYPYRVSESKWAGGELKVHVKISKAESSFSAGSVRVWSDNGKWSGNDTVATLNLNNAETFDVIGGLLTIYKRAECKHTVKQCKWFEQGIGFTVKEKKGWLVGGYHVECETKEDAIRKAKTARKNILKNDDTVLTIENVNKKFGFCFAGIRSFLELNGLSGVTQITVKELRNAVIANREINCKNYRSHLMKMGIIINCK